MRRLLTLATLTAVALSVSTTPAALAKASSIGNSNGAPTTNLCALSFACTYVNYQHGKPSDVIGHSGTLSHWSLNAGSVGGQVQLRVLRPVAHGELEPLRSSSWQTIANPGLNTFPEHMKVRAGDVLALTNSSSGIYMTTAPAGTCIRYFDAPIPDGSTGKPGRVAPQLHLLLSARVTG
jgi:hypothetical protein